MWNCEACLKIEVKFLPKGSTFIIGNIVLPDNWFNIAIFHKMNMSSYFFMFDKPF